MPRSFSSHTLPEDLTGFLAREEAKFDNIVPKTEKTILWNNPHKPEKTDLSLVYLHGFSATRQEVAPLCEELAQALGANLFYTRLTGHGQGNDAMASIRVDALLNDAQEAFEIGKRLGKKVILMGNSTGASLAVWLATRDQDNAIHSLVLLSPNFALANKRSELLLMPFGKYLLTLLQGKYYRFEPDNALQQQYWTTQFPSVALLPMMKVVKLVRSSALEKIQSPALMLYCEQDEVVSVPAIKKYFNRFGSSKKQLCEIKNTTSSKHHVLAGDILSPDSTGLVKHEILQFILKLPR